MEKQKQKKVTIRLNEQEYMLLRSALILKDQTVTGWVQLLVKKFLKAYEKEKAEKLKEKLI